MNNLKYSLYYLDNKIFLEPDKIYTIGRESDNIIQLPDQTASRKHAHILWQDGHFVIEDTNSTNGVFVNGEKCEKQILFDGDHITIGTFYLVYKEDNSDELDRTDMDYALTDTLVIEHQVAELLKSISDKKIQDKVINLKQSINKTKSKLDKLANRDRLTKLYNRRYFDEEIEKELERAVRYKYSLSLFMIDIDFFKKINDTYGHQKGDQVLAVVSSIISENTRLNDIVARYGGEEIVVLIPEMVSDNAMYLAEKIRSRVETETSKRIAILVTVSIGGAFYKTNDSSTNLIKKADDALYEAKKRGRNRVIINNHI
jgi:diguanylate cyclase (GGDEF)-like protein